MGIYLIYISLIVFGAIVQRVEGGLVSRFNSFFGAVGMTILLSILLTTALPNGFVMSPWLGLAVALAYRLGSSFGHSEIFEAILLDIDMYKSHRPWPKWQIEPFRKDAHIAAMIRGLLWGWPVGFVLSTYGLWNGYVKMVYIGWAFAVSFMLALPLSLILARKIKGVYNVRQNADPAWFLSEWIRGALVFAFVGILAL